MQHVQHLVEEVENVYDAIYPACTSIGEKFNIGITKANGCLNLEKKNSTMWSNTNNIGYLYLNIQMSIRPCKKT
jgi:hypothetical protein